MGVAGEWCCPYVVGFLAGVAWTGYHWWLADLKK